MSVFSRTQYDESIRPEETEFHWWDPDTNLTQFRHAEKGILAVYLGNTRDVITCPKGIDDLIVDAEQGMIEFVDKKSLIVAVYNMNTKDLAVRPDTTVNGYSNGKKKITNFYDENDVLIGYYDQKKKTMHAVKAKP